MRFYKLNNHWLLLVVLAAAAGCQHTLNYPSPLGPRYAGTPAHPAPAAPAGVLRVVTYNVQYGQHIDRAINVLSTRTPLPGADVIVLQEMDAEGTRRIAEALGMSWVYYPAVVHSKAARHDFGNAVLSRWPIVGDAKLLLPRQVGPRHAQRIATAVTILVDTLKVRVYSAHLGTITEIRPSKRREQAHTIHADAEAYPFVIVAGDMNSHGIGKEFVADGYQWPTEHNGFTRAVFNWDHVFLKGFAPAPGKVKSTGIVRDTLHASDHDPVWAVANLR
ncbi:MAG TPA: endonuclease/exonuclease/phosphatase family protein [Gemmatimonadales bacterium]|nr:endonuclease/exonuclease/phosphatase family protein [Gemmatimonadales bacterium]